MMRRRILVAIILFCSMLAAARAQTFDPFVIKDIRVEGLQRTEPGTVFSYLPVKVGDSMTVEKAQQSLRALFATGFFRDVRLEVSGDVLIVYVEERPAIAQIDFSGVKEFDTATLKRVLREQGLAEGRIFDRSLLENAEQEMKRQYLSRGLYAAQVQTTVTPLERNRVALIFSVVEGEVARIRSINLVGVKAFPEKELLSLFVSRTPGWLTWFTKHDQYSQQRLAGDLETLKSYYMDRGYLDFDVESTQVSITPDRRDIFVTVNLREGAKYTVTGVKLAGTMLVPKEELEKLINLKAGEPFSRTRLAATTKAITDRLGNDGYAFANANAVPEVDKEKAAVAFTILIDPGRRVYIRRINVSGNTKTRDEVIRREMRQLEGAFYDASKIQLSKRRIDRTQYFADVTVETQPVEGSSDQVDVNFAVKEKPTGSLLLGAGISSSESVVVSGSITQSNVFGSGKFLSLNINSSSVNKTYSISYLDPYYTVDGVSRGFDVYRRDTDATSLSVAPYATKAFGGGLKFAYPLSEIASVNFGISGESVKLTTFADSPFQYVDFVSRFGKDYVYASGTAGWTRDTRDSLIQPREGALSRVSAELGQGDLAYYKLGFDQQWFRPLSRTYTLFLNAALGIGDGLGGKPLPFFKNYFVGGAESVRGYRAFSLGPQAPNGEAVGGQKKVNGSLEILFPVPGAEQDKSLRLGAFLDAGQVYASGQKIDFGELRYSTGLSFLWSSPVGPLRLSLAAPLNNKTGDRLQRLQFTFGTGF